MGEGIFVVGTDTDVGKTFVSAVIIQALKMKKKSPMYYKPIASGGNIDLETVKLYGELTDSQAKCPIIFETPCSPHLASEIEDVILNKETIIDALLEEIRKNEYTVVEGAGGIIVPIVRNELVLDQLIIESKLPVIIVARTHVGTINHTLLTIEYLKSKEVSISGIVFNGYQNRNFEDDNIEFIKKESGIAHISVLPEEKNIDKDTVKKLANDYILPEIGEIL